MSATDRVMEEELAAGPEQFAPRADRRSGADGCGGATEMAEPARPI